MNITAALRAIASADLSPLDVEADLTIAIEGEEIQVKSRTNKPLVDLPSMGVALALARQLGGGGLRLLPELAGVLAAADLTVGVAIDGTGIAVLGAEAEPGRLAKRFGTHVELRENGLARTLRDATLGR